MILYGFTSMRGSTRSTFGTASTIASASRNETPSDFLRSSWRSSGFTCFARTITLRRPRRPMASSAFSSAPAPMESMAMTAPTPKIIPSIVSDVRSLWRLRLVMAVKKVSRSFIAHLCGIVALRRVFQGDLVAFVQSFGHDDAPRARRADRHFRGRERVALLHVDDALAVLLEQRLARDGERIGLVLDFEDRPHARTRLHQLRIGAVEIDGHAKVLHRLARDARPRHLVHGLHFARVLEALIGLEEHSR